MYENVTEGTPVSPVFDTLKEMEDWLVKTQGYAKEAAATFCSTWYAPTFMIDLQGDTTDPNSNTSKDIRDPKIQMAKKKIKGKRL